MADLIFCKIKDFSLAKSSLSENGTIWVECSSGEKLNDLCDFHLENSLVVCNGEETKTFYHYSKSDKYIWNSVEVLREVVVPYTVKGKNGERIKRGWDYLNGKPMRWTSLGNALYCSDEDFLKQLLVLTSSNESSSVVEFPDTKIERDYSMLEGKASTSEDCKLSFKNRSFLPKEK